MKMDEKELGKMNINKIYFIVIILFTNKTATYRKIAFSKVLKRFRDIGEKIMRMHIFLLFDFSFSVSNILYSVPSVESFKAIDNYRSRNGIMGIQ